MTGTTQKRRRGRPRTMDADQVLDTAMTALWRGDPAAVSINAICQLAAVSKPSLYRVFGSEDGLTRAALDRYAERVLADVFTILQAGQGLAATLDALVDFATADPRMETGCLFYKLRAGRHRLGPKTRARLQEIDAAAQAAYAAFLVTCRKNGELADDPSINTAAAYLSEQLALAITQRASGEDPRLVRPMLELALSVFTRDPGAGTG